LPLVEAWIESVASWHRAITLLPPAKLGDVNESSIANGLEMNQNLTSIHRSATLKINPHCLNCIVNENAIVENG
jgi:hypothetical protein